MKSIDYKLIDYRNKMQTLRRMQDELSQLEMDILKSLDLTELTLDELNRFAVMTPKSYLLFEIFREINRKEKENIKNERKS